MWNQVPCLTQLISRFLLDKVFLPRRTHNSLKISPSPLGNEIHSEKQEWRPESNVLHFPPPSTKPIDRNQARNNFMSCSLQPELPPLASHEENICQLLLLLLILSMLSIHPMQSVYQENWQHWKIGKGTLEKAQSDLKMNSIVKHQIGLIHCNAMDSKDHLLLSTVKYQIE